MNGFGWIVLIGAAVVGLSYFNTGKNLMNLSFDLNGVNDIVIKLLSSKMTLKFSVYNPSNSVVKLQQVTANVMIGGAYVGNFDVRQEITINAGATETLLIPVNISNVSALTAVIDLVQSRGEYKEIEIKGKVKADGLLFPLDESSEFQVPGKTNKNNVPKL